MTVNALKAATLRVAASVLAGLALVAGPALAQVEVVESNNRLLGPSANSASSGRSSADASAANSAAVARPQPQPLSSQPSIQSQLYFQLQTLQQEVLELRGLVEEQAHELQRLKQQRLDDYLDLDRRLNALGSGQQAAKGETDKRREPSVARGGREPDEIQRYRSAIDLVLRDKDYEQAITAFNQYLRDFPQGRYAANSQYWLGEIFLLQGELEKAREWFGRLLAEHEQHDKVPDARYKLGTVYHQLGDGAKARELLTQVAEGDSNAARLATDYLAKMGS